MANEWIEQVAEATVLGLTGPPTRDGDAAAARTAIREALSHSGPLADALRNAYEKAVGAFVASLQELVGDDPRTAEQIRLLTEGSGFRRALGELAFMPWPRIDLRRCQEEIVTRLGTPAAKAFDVAWYILGKRFQRAAAESPELEHLLALMRRDEHLGRDDELLEGIAAYPEHPEARHAAASAAPGAMSSCLLIPVEDLLFHRRIEAQRVEFKSTWDERVTPPQVLNTICAFANDFHNVNGGYLILGVEERSGVAVMPPRGLDPERLDAIQRAIRGQCRNLDPEYQPILSPEIVEGRHLLVVWVPASEIRPHSAPGRRPGERTWWIRLGAETVKARRPQLPELMRLTARFPFDDRRAPEHSINRLRSTLVREFLDEVGSALVNEPDELTIYRRMRLTARINGYDVPRNVALLFFSDDADQIFPGARIDVVHFRNGAGGDVIEERIFRGPLHRQVRECLNYLGNWITHHIRKHPDRPEASTWTSYPMGAIEEVVVNAVHHRDYESSSEPTKVYIYPDRLEVTSYPGPVPGLMLEDFQSGSVPQVTARNRRIGELLKELQLAETRGTGVAKIFAAMQANGSSRPQFLFREERSFFTVILPAHPAHVAEGGPPAAGLLVAPPLRGRPTIPPARREFTGRTEELAALRREIGAHSGARIYAVRGLGGVGKTELAYKLVEEVGAEYPDGQVLVELGGTSDRPLTVAEAMAEVIRAFEPQMRLPDGEAELRRIYHELLRDRRILLLLDDAASAEQVEPLLPHPGCLTLVTSRLRFALPDLYRQDLDVLSAEAARELLLRLAPRLEEVAEEIVDLLGRLPLALRLAGSAFAERPGLEPAEYLRRLGSREERVGLVAAVIDFSYRALACELRRQWRMLAVFPGDFDAAGAGAVWELDAAAAEEVLDGELLRVSLVEHRDGRYRLQDLARDFAAERLEPGEVARRFRDVNG